jgi:hypothetical protein
MLSRRARAWRRGSSLTPLPFSAPIWSEEGEGESCTLGTDLLTNCSPLRHGRRGRGCDGGIYSLHQFAIFSNLWYTPNVLSGLAPSSSGPGRHPLKVEIAGSNPAGVTRARRLAVRMPPCQGGGRGFESRRARQMRRKQRQPECSGCLCVYKEGGKSGYV